MGLTQTKIEAGVLQKLRHAGWRGKNGLREEGFIDMHNIYPWQGVYISENDSRGKKLKGKKKRGKKGKKGKGAKIKGKRGRGKKKRKKGRGEEKMGQKGGKNKGW